MDKKFVLVTGSTGYIASKLIPELLEHGYRVRCLVRQPQGLKARAWFSQVEIAVGDVMVPSTLLPAMEGVHTAYYLVHNMTSGQGYTDLEKNSAQIFANVAEQAGVEHIIYLGGLAHPQGTISSHMRSRIRTGETLRKGMVPVTEFRAGVIVGPGSISFEMIRFMTELMPVVLGPNWLQNLAQPIAAQNVIDYLLAALKEKANESRVFEIGGPDTMSYVELMLAYGRLRGLSRRYVIVHGIPVWFMALGVDWMTPVPAVIATPLVDGMRSESIVQDDSARQVFSDVRLIGYEEAVTLALGRLRPDCIEPIWIQDEEAVKAYKHEGFFIDHRCLPVAATPEKVFQIFTNMGGKRGWPYANGLWKIRGWLDKLLGGPGLRASTGPMKEDQVVDYYRVETVEPNRLIRLYSELKAPGVGWMEWRVRDVDGGAILSQTGFFAPRGFWGFAYWILLNPFHRFVFRGMIRAIARQSEA